MRKCSNKNMGRAAASVVAGLVLLMSFQNCGKAGFDAGLDDSADLSSSDAALTTKYGSFTASKVEAIPFAFESAFDTMTYISCADTHVNNSDSFYSLMAGAYATGGVKLKDEYWNYADSNFNPIYPAKNLSYNQYKNFLADSPANKGAIPTMAVRVKNSLTEVYARDSNLILGLDVIPLIGNLTDSLVMDSLVQKGVASAYFPFAPESKNFEGAMKFNESELMAEKYRSLFMSSGSLAITYMSDETEFNKVRAADPEEYPVRKAYGKSYGLTFKPYTTPGAASTNPLHVLGQVIEADLSGSGETPRTWNCNRVYRIIRSQDAAAFCPAQNYSDVAGANQMIRNEYEIVRRQLRADQWDINVTQRCIVPKSGVSCYKEESVNNNPVVQYDLTKECYRGPHFSGYTGGAAPNSRCMHFATVCVRN